MLHVLNRHNPYTTVAERVVKNSPHLVVGQELKVVLAEEQSLKEEPSNLLLKNIPPDTHIDHLELYMDSVTGLLAENGDYQLHPKPGGLYLVIFNSALGKWTKKYTLVIVNCVL